MVKFLKFRLKKLWKLNELSEMYKKIILESYMKPINLL